MSELAEHWRDARAFKRDMRSQWHDCPNCIYGGNARKIAPGCKCHECGWRAPGRAGEDIERAREIEAERFASELADEAERRERVAARTCDFCKKTFASKEAMSKHRGMVHRKRLEKAGAP